METNETVGVVYRQIKALHLYLERKGHYNHRVLIAITTPVPLSRPQPGSWWSRLIALVGTRTDLSGINRPFSFCPDIGDDSLVMLETGQLARRRPSDNDYEIVDLLTLTPDELEEVKSKLDKWIVIINSFDRRFTESKPHQHHHR